MEAVVVRPATTAARTLTEYIERAGSREPDRLAFRIRGQDATHELSYRALFARAERYSGAYRAAEVAPGTNVLIVLPHSPDLLCAFIGAVFAGLVPAVLPPPATRQDPGVYWQHMTEMVRAAPGAPIVATASLQATLPPGSPIGERALLSPESLPECVAPVARHRAAPGDTAFLQYSSGTTGLRKGVVITHRMFAAQVEAYRAALQVTDGDRIASWLPLYHDMGLVACFLEPLALGLSATLIDPFLWVSRPRTLFEQIADFRATHVWMPNFAFNHLVDTVGTSAPLDLSSVKAFVNSSEPCKVETFERFLQAFGSWGVRAESLQTSYALAEAVFAATQSPPGKVVRTYDARRDALAGAGRVEPAVEGEPRVRLLSAGRVLDGLDVRVTVGERGRAAPAGTVGEIELRGAMIAARYYNNEPATRAAMRDGWYRTGDLGVVLDGELYITGRKKERLIVHGRNYYAHDIEAVVSRCPGVKPGRAVALGRANAVTGSEDLVIVAERASSPDPPDDAAVIRSVKAAVFEALGVTAASVHFVPAGSLVKTTSGKLDREHNYRKFVESGR